MGFSGSGEYYEMKWGKSEELKKKKPKHEGTNADIQNSPHTILLRFSHKTRL